MPDYSLPVQDIRWLIVQCRESGLEKPTSAVMEQFAERVAIKVADGTADNRARREAFEELYAWVGHGH